MDSQYLQQQRFNLQKRVRRLNSCNYQLFHSSFVQFWNYLHAQPLLAGVLARMKAQSPDYTEQIKSIDRGNGIEIFAHEHEAAAYVYRVVEYCAQQPVDGRLGPEMKIGRSLTSSSKHDDALDAFRENFLESFYELLDEALDQQGAVLSLLIKYKRKVEWFERTKVSEIAKQGERELAKHLYAYLFEQGLDFHIEPQSISGEADLVAPELVLDAKVFDGESSSRGVRYLKSGVNQLLTYTRDFNQTVGYLVVYRTCPEDLQFSFARSDMLVPHIVLGGKTLYLLIIDICQYDTSASKRGTLRAHVVDEEVLRVVIGEPTLPDSATNDVTSLVSTGSPSEQPKTV